MRIQVVEDAAEVRDRLVRLLADRPGMEVVAQADGATAAIEGCRRCRPDVVLLDLRLAEGDGMQVLRAVKDERPAPVVVVLTAHADRFHRRRCLEAGADGFIDKWIEVEQAFAALDSLAQNDYIWASGDRHKPRPE